MSPCTLVIVVGRDLVRTVNTLSDSVSSVTLSTHVLVISDDKRRRRVGLPAISYHLFLRTVDGQISTSLNSEANSSVRQASTSKFVCLTSFHRFRRLPTGRRIRYIFPVRLSVV